MVVAADLKAHTVSANEVLRRHELRGNVGRVDAWPAQPESRATQANGHVAIVGRDRHSSLDIEMYRFEIRSRRRNDVVFELPITQVENGVDSRIQVRVANFSKLRNVRAPRRGVGPAEVITSSRKLIDSAHTCIRTLSREGQVEVSATRPAPGVAVPIWSRHNDRDSRARQVHRIRQTATLVKDSGIQLAVIPLKKHRCVKMGRFSRVQGCSNGNIQTQEQALNDPVDAPGTRTVRAGRIHRTPHPTAWIRTQGEKKNAYTVH